MPAADQRRRDPQSAAFLAADNDLGAGSYSGQAAVDPKLQRRIREALQAGENAEDHNAHREGTNPADIIRDDAKDEAADGPAQQSDHAEHATNSADIGKARLRAKELGQRGTQNKREQAKISGIQYPAKPHHQEYAPLIGCDVAKPAQRAYRNRCAVGSR